MVLKRVIPFAHSLLEESLNSGDIAIDATVGNGNDTLYLATLVGESGKVYGFDIQKQAIKQTSERLKEENLNERVSLFEQSHDQLINSIPERDHGNVSCAIFNLGYLPGSDKTVTTKGETTIAAIEQLLTVLKKSGLIVLVVYHGHPEGKEERNQLMGYVKGLDQKKAHVIKYEFLNQVNAPPFIVAIQKR